MRTSGRKVNRGRASRSRGSMPDDRRQLMAVRLLHSTAAPSRALTVKRQVLLAGWRSSVLHHLTDVSQCRVQHRLLRNWHRLAHAGITRTDRGEDGKRVRNATASLTSN